MGDPIFNRTNKTINTITGSRNNKPINEEIKSNKRFIVQSINLMSIYTNTGYKFR